jgi:tetratricopeptide (TPR) repeat protein
MYLDADMPQKAFELLERIPKGDRVRTPAVIRAYARALALVAAEHKEKFDPLFTAFANAAFSEADKAKDPALALAVALGLLDCPPTKDRAFRAKEIANDVFTRWPASVEAIRARAQARVRFAEEDDPRWSDANVQAAVTALNMLKTRDPNDLWAPAMLAWVRYQGGQPVDHAWRELGTVLKAEADPTLPAEILEVIGTLYLARGQADDAVRVLQRAAETARQPAGPLVTLALAYYKLSDRYKARETLDRAATLSRSGRVQDEYTKAHVLINKE